MNIFQINLYLLFFWYFATRLLNKNRRNLVFCIAACIQLIIIVGLRDLSLGDSGMVSDIKQYENHFYAVKSLSLSGILSYNEGKSGLFYLILSLFSKSGVDYPEFVFVYIAFVMIVVSWYIKKYSQAPLISYLIFFGHAGFTASYYLYRQSIAMVLLLIAFHFLVSKNNLKMWVLIIIALLVHYTVLALIPFFFIASIKYNKKILFLTLLLFWVVFFYRNELALRLTRLFAEDALITYDSKGSVGVLALTCISFLILFVLFKFNDIRKMRLSKYDQACLYGLVFASVYQVLSSFAYTFTRLNLYFFQMIIMVAIPNLFSLSYLKTKTKELYAPISLVGNVIIASLMIYLYFSALKSEGLLI